MLLLMLSIEFSEVLCKYGAGYKYMSFGNYTANRLNIINISFCIVLYLITQIIVAHKLIIVNEVRLKIWRRFFRQN